MGKIIDLTGNIYGRLTVLKFDHIKDSRAYWLCQCSCGKTSTVSKHELERKDGRSTKSCGCLKEEARIKRCVTHGDTKSKEHRTWMSIKARCHRVTQAHYFNYGGRGIIVCDRWRYSYENFLSDMGRAPSPKHSIGRINNDGNYEPGNCRWEDSFQQANNTRGNVPVTINGKTQNLRHWAKEMGIHENTLYNRINQMGWTPEQAVTTPAIMGLRRKHEFTVSARRQRAKNI